MLAELLVFTTHRSRDDCVQRIGSRLMLAVDLHVILEGCSPWPGLVSLTPSFVTYDTQAEVI